MHVTNHGYMQGSDEMTLSLRENITRCISNLRAKGSRFKLHGEFNEVTCLKVW
jgi:hypothetical protein